MNPVFLVNTSTTYVALTLALCFLVVGQTSPAAAQVPTWTHQLALTAGSQSPMAGSLSNGYHTGVGFKGTYYFRTSRHSFFGFGGGYHWFQADGTDTVLDAIPLQLAFKFNFSLTGLQPYIGSDGGLVLLHNTASSETRNEYGVAPKFGFRLPIARGADLDLNITYEVIFTDPEPTTYLGANAGLAYIFGR